MGRAGRTLTTSYGVTGWSMPKTRIASGAGHFGEKSRWILASTRDPNNTLGRTLTESWSSGAQVSFPGGGRVILYSPGEIAVLSLPYLQELNTPSSASADNRRPGLLPSRIPNPHSDQEDINNTYRQTRGNIWRVYAVQLDSSSFPSAVLEGDAARKLGDDAGMRDRNSGVKDTRRVPNCGDTAAQPKLVGLSSCQHNTN